jgi:hypothetical protein
MKCSNHPKIESVAVCASCGKPFCASCIVALDERSWCRECLTRLVAGTGEGARVHPGWRKLAAGCLSIIPGAGHMFLGLIGKGFALMGLLMLSVFLIILYSDTTGMFWMTAYLIPTLGVLFLSYAVFDALAIADAQRSGRPLPSSGDDDTMKGIWERVLLNRATSGWVLLVAGAVGVLHLFSVPFEAWTRTHLSVGVPITGLVIPVVLLVIGIRLLQKSRNSK